MIQRIDCEIKGDILLMHSPKSMLDEKPATTTRTEKHDYDAEAEKSAYKTDKGVLYLPTEALFSSILNGGSMKKAGKYPVRSLLAGNLKIEPKEEIPLLDVKGKPITKYIVDLRTVVIQQGKKRNRIIRARAKIENWSAKFVLSYDDIIVGNPDIIKSCLLDAGNRVGLLEKRPQTSGNYGTFEIVKFDMLPEKKTK